LTPGAEPEFNVSWKPYEAFEQYHRFKNVMFLARLDSQEPLSAMVTKSLNDEVKAGVRSGDYFYIPQENVWALNQYVVYLVAPSEEEMIQRLYDLGELVYDNFTESYFSRLRERVFGRFENKELGEYLSNNFPFSMRIQHDYYVMNESMEERFVWLRRVDQRREIDRSLIVHWMPIEDSLRINREWMVGQRNKLGARLLEGDIVVERETKVVQSRFGKYPALRLEGTWMNPRLVVGGPFRTITFVDRDQGLIFMIDFYVQAIGERKKPFLDQLEIIAHTLKPDPVPSEGE
ncbi:MAG TPA: DUF4837 family protein, partial [Calditrichia bacterium]|nr:DUF4837 family protein [Calditrichia bacterium]